MDRPLRIALGDLSYFTYASDANKVGWDSNLYVPLNIGFLAAYAKYKFAKNINVVLFKDTAAMLQHIRTERPELIGLTAYYWNDELDNLVVRKIRAISGYRPMIVLGGPSIDSDPTEQALYKARHPGVDYLVPNEGEVGFASIVGSMLGGSEIRIPIGLSTDLVELPSPYLDGTLDPFLDGPFQPLIQTSRLCPYTCTFCVSGKNIGKLRAFELDRVQEEIAFVVDRFKTRPEYVLHIVDENFGILERDIDVAVFLRNAHDRVGYPAKLFYYNDKRFTHICRSLQQVLGSICYHGVTLSLQSDNPETLKDIKRRNLTDEEIVSAISWAHSLGLRTTTELIFGLPHETRASFKALLDKCARLGFDRILCRNLIIFDGIEMNRVAYRGRLRLKTKRRLMNGSAQWVDGELCAESEEVVVSSSTFGFEDYLFFRALNTWFHAIFFNGLHKAFFERLVARGDSLADFIERMLVPIEGEDPAARAHKAFLAEMDSAMKAELHDEPSLTELIADVAAGRKQLPVEIKLQPIFARKLVENEHGWVADIIARTAGHYTDHSLIAATRRPSQAIGLQSV
jgi:radical SAM superfamily enzyme YgiQ (UPF0313 family)